MQTQEGVNCFSKMIFTVFYTMIGRVGTRYVSRDEREEKRRRRRGIGIASFIIRLPAISPASVIPHDLGGFSLRSKALPDKTVQIEFDSYRLLYSDINLVFAIDTHTSVLTLAVFALYIFKSAAFSFPHVFPLTSSCPFFFFSIADSEDRGKKKILFTLFECRYATAQHTRSFTECLMYKPRALITGHHRVKWMSDKLALNTATPSPLLCI